MPAPKKDTKKTRKPTPKEVSDWYTDKVHTAAGIRKNIVRNAQQSRDRAVIGKMFFFVYDPKHKDTLPIYDKFPLVFPIEPYQDGFLGLNIHYLSIGERITIINQLLSFANNDKMDRRTRLQITYGLLNSTKKLHTLSRPCIKRYLFGHVRSKFIEVPADEWDKAISLPVEQFVIKR